ncbi:MAG: MATE family efflux transporter [Bacteroidales bacterium]|nr:MATE family efflux transporter [Bacteroidales bacterium]
MSNSEGIDFGNGRVGSLFVKVLVPTLLGLTFSSLFLLVDGIFVGHGIGSEGLAAVNIVMPIFTMATGIGMMFAIGSSVVAAIHLAQDNIMAARQVVTQAFVSVLALGALLALILYAAPDRILSLLGAEGPLMDRCREYYMWFAPCGLCVMVQIVSQFIIRLDGNPNYSGLVEVVPACVNIFLDWLFIFPMGWGLMGAAFATSLGSFIGVLMSLWYFAGRSRVLSLTGSAFNSRIMRNVANMMRLGFSGFLGELSMSVLTIMGNYSFMKILGYDGVASFCIALYIFPVVYMICAAAAQSAQPIESYNYGKGAWDRVRTALRISIISSVSVGLLLTLLICFFPDAVVSVFIDDSSPVYGLCVRGLPLFALSFVFMAVSVCSINYYQAVERPVRSVVLTLLRGMVLPVVAFSILPFWLSSDGLWLAVPVAEALTFAVLLLLRALRA